MASLAPKSITHSGARTGSTKARNQGTRKPRRQFLPQTAAWDDTTLRPDEPTDRHKLEQKAEPCVQSLWHEPLGQASQLTTDDDLGCWTDNDGVNAIVENRDLAPGPYKRGSLLGSGGLGDVYKVLRVADGKVFAGKTSTAVLQMHEEARLLRLLKHEHILNYIDWYEEEQNPAATLLVTELCTGGMLQTKINNASHGMSAIDILLVISQISSALAHIHALNLFHTDVKPHNILIRTHRPLRVVLADCADVRPVGLASKLRGTRKYWSPEMVQQRRHCGPADDVWALGLTVMGMLAQWPRMLYTEKGLRAYPAQCAAHARTLVGLNPRDEVVRLLGRMLALRVEERAGAGECADRAGELLVEIREGGEERWSREGELGIKAPEDFQAVAFW